MKTSIEGGIRFCIDLKFTAAEMGTWSPERIASFFEGIATVQRAVRDDIIVSKALPSDAFMFAGQPDTLASLPAADDASQPGADDDGG